jgi:hypothetical protein
LAEQASARPAGEPAGSDAAVVAQQAVAARCAAVVPQQEAAAPSAVEVPQQAVAWVAAEELPPAAAWVGVEEPRQEVAAWAAAAVRQPVAARQREAPDVRGAEPRAARPSGAPWVFHRGQLRRPALPAALQPTARLARAMQRLRTASP